MPVTAKPDAESPSVVDLEERKERVLHTRVPDSLDRHIKRRARSLGMSVSTVVRNVLLTTFGLVEDIVNDSTDIALAVTGHEGVRSRGRTRGPAASASPEPIAWQEAVLNVNAVCDQCNAILAKGTRAAVGVHEQPGPRAVLCRACLGALERRVASPPKGRR
jgi:hypothetical protein